MEEGEGLREEDIERNNNMHTEFHISRVGDDSTLLRKRRIRAK